ncbi:MAG: phosphoadenylyl-sulfate reductase [Actinomycetota bacterium]
MRSESLTSDPIAIHLNGHARDLGRFASPDTHFGDLDDAHPRVVLEWVCTTVESLAVATSFQLSGMVILHLLKDIRPDVPVLFLDTGFHFPETLDFRRRIQGAWGLNVIDLHGEHGFAERQAEIHGPELYRRDPDRCCYINKVKPLQDALESYDAWISGIRRDQSPLRARTPMVEAQMLPSGNEVLKVHPLANWSRADVEGYVREHDVPTHPLLDDGYRSIGCRPCTQRVDPGEDERAGRWNDFSKTECGIHSFGKQGSRESEAEQ